MFSTFLYLCKIIYILKLLLSQLSPLAHYGLASDAVKIGNGHYKSASITLDMKLHYKHQYNFRYNQYYGKSYLNTAINGFLLLWNKLPILYQLHHNNS